MIGLLNVFGKKKSKGTRVMVHRRKAGGCFFYKVLVDKTYKSIK